jgi:hypothetical protein
MPVFGYSDTGIQLSHSRQPHRTHDLLRPTVLELPFHHSDDALVESCCDNEESAKMTDTKIALFQRPCLLRQAG